MNETQLYGVKKHWDRVGGVKYQRFWNSTSAHKELSKKEKQFIKRYIPKKTVKALDYGTGSGRFLSVLIKCTNDDSKIYALDISEEMVRYCREKFGKNKKLAGIETVKNLQHVRLFETKFDFIIAIRALKYNSDWKKYLAEFCEMLEDDGIIIITMPKRYFLNRIYESRRLFRVSMREVKSVACELNMKVTEIKGFAKIPDFFYRINNVLFSRGILFCENIMNFLFGTRLFEREVFYVLKKRF